ncbi:mannosyl-glycoprotein endo-beta-N-acetylglucosamidase [Siminovitchia acidinfaciens]|uniref:Mannosyl-glycoprotein endo-beta-N-acetylglucosamidase n=1 Tax=Siminovitchia acidinfaciens TaxID=2321395 RepID=A0A429XZI6_9BACI|nr:SH3 domain-containing protein [Siminovitchia acidinfaciens]RST74214.1 mannosyl-glycoprotein endo-beta-N-acetylglucosamidase [Siminovitchia acidinfaciens]
MRKLSFFIAILLIFSSFPNHLLAEEVINEQTDSESIPAINNSEKESNPSPENEETTEIKVESQFDVSSPVVEKKEETGKIEDSTEAPSKKESHEELDTSKPIKENIKVKESIVEDNNSGKAILDVQSGENQAFQIQATNEIEEKGTSRLGHIRNSNVKIYSDLSLQSSIIAGPTYTHHVYYIKKQAIVKGQTYYLISRQPSSVRGIVGWVRALDLSTQQHLLADKSAKTFYIKGTGSAYSKAWGGRKDFIYPDLSKYKGQMFAVHLTETVGNNIWYRGKLNGKTVWIHSGNVFEVKESKTSKLGHIRSSKVRIYNDLGLNSSIGAGSTYTNYVYYIKKQALINGETYYLISKQPSSERGVIGWVKASDLSTQSHLVVDKQPKTFFIIGTGSAYSKAWGGRKDYIYSDLAKYKDHAFQVHLTESVGKNVWYRGKLKGKTVWIHSKYVGESKESKTSRLGHLKSSKVKIYRPDFSSAFTAGSTYTHSVYYIKKQSIINGQTFYLISKEPSSIKGLIGWVKAADITSHPHVVVDKENKTFYLKGTGSAYSKAWGGRKDYIYPDLKKYSNQAFNVQLTEKVGTSIWYRGKINGKTVWVRFSEVKDSSTRYTDYNLTFQEAVNIQMKRSPQTDKYRNQNAFIHKDFVDIVRSGVITGSLVRLRTTPEFGDNISTTVNSGTKVTILGTVDGDLHEGSRTWYKINYNKSTLYVHSSLVNPNAMVGTTTANVNIRESASSNSHVYATLPKGTQVNIIKEGSTWHEISYGAWRNAKASDVEQYLNPNENSPYQHLLLTSSVGVGATELNKVLVGKGVLQGLGQAFIDGGKRHSVNEIYLISHALLETGQGTSNLAKGIEVGKDSSGKAVLVTSSNRKSLKDIKKVYNMFGIKAYDSCPNTCGAIHAYEQGWDTPYKAVVGGAKFIGEDYIHNQYNQNTIYKMRWNFIYPPKQYATDVGWAVKQTARIKSLYDQLINPSLEFDIPRFK